MKVRSSKRKPTMPLSYNLWFTLFRYILSGDDVFSKPFAGKLRNFLDSVDHKAYKENGDIVDIYEAVVLMVDLMLDENVYTPDMLLERIISSERYNDLLDELDADIEENESLSLDDAVFIENEINGRLSYIDTLDTVENFERVMEKMRSEDFTSFSNIMEEVRDVAQQTSKHIAAKAYRSNSVPSVNLDGGDAYKTIISKTRLLLNDDRRTMKTGIKRLNRFFGNIEPTRVYVINAISGGLTSAHVKIY